MNHIALAFVFALALAAPALADQRPVWALPADQITVITVGTTHGMPVATVRDSGMRGHNIYCVSQGAHFGKLTVTRISETGVALSNGRVLPVEFAAPATVAAVNP